ncbi:MAG: DUF819 family protein [Bdellovibrionales bacterium]|nr:DUF819 family protein [Bdellovibrionales bacterium]
MAQIPLILGTALGILWMESRLAWVRALSAVVVAYGAGLVLAHIPGAVPDAGVSAGIAQGAVLAAIPLMLFSADLGGWLKLARPTAIATGVAFFSVCVAAIAAGAYFLPRFGSPVGPELAGMFTGSFTGSAPNLAAVGAALGAAPETLLAAQTADLMVCGIFCLLFLSPALRWVAGFLPPFRPSGEPGKGEAGAETVGDTALRPPWSFPPAQLLRAAGLSLGVAAAAGAAALAAPPSQQMLVALLGVSTLASCLSLSRRVRALPATYELGQAIFLVFCVAVGSQANFARLAASGLMPAAYAGAQLLIALALHLLLCRLLRIDRDTAIISITAAVYSPAFVGPVASTLGNRRIVVSGVTAGLVGLAVGTGLGLAVAAVAASWLSGRLS